MLLALGTSCSPQGHMHFLTMLPWEQLGTAVQLGDAAPAVTARGRLVGIPLPSHTSLLPLGGGEGLAAGSRCVSSAPSRTPPAPRFVVWLERHCCWMGTGAVLPGTACSVAAGLLLVAEAARSPLQAANWVPLNTFPKPKSGPRMVATSHCLDLMIGLVQQVRGCWGSVHPAGLGQDPGGSGMLSPLWQRMGSLRMAVGWVPRFGGAGRRGGVDASTLLSCTAQGGPQLADASAM